MLMRFIGSASQSVLCLDGDVQTMTLIPGSMVSSCCKNTRFNELCLFCPLPASIQAMHDIRVGTVHVYLCTCFIQSGHLFTWSRRVWPLLIMVIEKGADVKCCCVCFDCSRRLLLTYWSSYGDTPTRVTSMLWFRRQHFEHFPSLAATSSPSNIYRLRYYLYPLWPQ